MKCIHCDNELPINNNAKDIRGFATPKTVASGAPKGRMLGKIACTLPGCKSHGLNPRTKEYREIVMGLTAEEVQQAANAKAQKGVETQRAKGYFDDPSNNPFSKAFWIKQGMTEAEATAKLSERSKKAVETQKEMGYFDDPSNNPFSKAFWVKQGMTEAEATAKINNRLHNRPEFWVARGYSVEEAKLKASISADTNSLDSKIEKYGTEQGPIKYQETTAALSASWTSESLKGLQNGKSSREANIFFLKLYRRLRRRGFTRKDFFLEINKGEFFLNSGDNFWFYDCLIKPLNLIIEYNGSHVHPNTTMSNEAWSNWRHAYNKRSADEVAERDATKKSYAESKGFTVLTVWDTDNCVDKFIESYIK